MRSNEKYLSYENYSDPGMGFLVWLEFPGREQKCIEDCQDLSVNPEEMNFDKYSKKPSW